MGIIAPMLVSTSGWPPNWMTLKSSTTLIYEILIVSSVMYGSDALGTVAPGIVVVSYNHGAEPCGLVAAGSPETTCIR